MKQHSGGAGGIRTLDRALQPYNGLANRRLQPLGHSSIVTNQALSLSVRWLKPQFATGLPPAGRGHRSLPVRRAASIALAAVLSVCENRWA
jgi:hypothetical protein